MPFKKVAWFTARLAIIAGLILFIFYPELFGLGGLFGGIKPADVWNELKDAGQYSMGWLLLCLALASGVKMLGIFAGIIKWSLLLNGQGLRLPFGYLTHVWFTGRVVGWMVPGGFGLDAWRLVESSRYTGDWVKCTTVVAIDKLIGFISLTLLVVLTFPFGFALLDINPVLFAVIMLVLTGFTLFCFTLLFNPRIIQIAVSVVPLPGKIRRNALRFGAAATAYSGHRRMLLLAVLFGVFNHFATSIMFFFTMLAIRAENTSIFDIMFAAPIMIYATILAPTIKGIGVREFVFGQLLGKTAGYSSAVTFSHLGLWTGEVIPFLLSIPVLLLGGRPSRKKLEDDLTELRRHSGDHLDTIQLADSDVALYRGRVYGTLVAGILGGLAAGALIALLEAAWLLRTLEGLTEVQMFTWGPVVYGLIFAGAGAGVAGALLFLYLLLDRFASWGASYALSFAGAFTAGGLIIGVFRFKRDVLSRHAMGAGDFLQVGLWVLAIAGIGWLLLFMLSRLATILTKRRPGALVAAGLTVFLTLLLAGMVAGALSQPEKVEAAFNPPASANGPNIILLTVDTLRADYLRRYNPEAAANTPALDAFTQDAVLFQNGFAQASWTKPSYGTMFSGLYPEQHTATTQTAALPDSIDTVAELLQRAGYFTKGFPNNPNVSPIFNFGQGFVEYTYLEPSLYFGANTSSAKLALYEVLRRVRQTGSQKLAKVPGLGALNRIVVTEFYQPAPVVTQHALDWLDRGATDKSPFYLYLHYMDPHDPFMDPESPEGGYARVRMENPEPELADPMKKAYVREIEYLDQHLAALFDGLKQRGLYENTLIIFTSDHGEEFFDHEGWWHGQTLYDELTKIPFIVKLPGNQQAGVVNQDLARHVDLAPTILHLAGLKKPPVMPGLTLWDPQLGFTNAAIAFSYSENDFEGNILQSVRSKESKIIHANEDNPRKLAPVELYNMAEDPAEQHDLAQEPASAAQKQSLQQTLADYQKVIEENTAEPLGDIDASQMNDQLESLGYL